METGAVRYSFLIPTRGRLGQVRETLQALSALEAPNGSFEALVGVDGGIPEPGAWSLAESAGGMPLTLIAQDRHGPARARNVAAARAQGEWLVFLDDDCRLSRDYLRVLERALTSDRSLAVGGQPRTPDSAGIWTLATHIVVEAFVESQRRACGTPGFLPSQNLVVHRTAWAQTGGFNEDFRAAAGEDREFCIRWTRGGGRLARLPELRYVHDDPLDLRDFLRKHFQYGQGAARFLHEAGQEPLRRYRLFLRDAWRRATASRPRWRVPALTVGLALSQLATLAGVVFADRSHRDERKRSPARGV